MKFLNERPRSFIISCIVFLFLISSATYVFGFSPLRIYTAGELAEKADRIILVRYIEGTPELRNLQVVTRHRFRVVESVKTGIQDGVAAAITVLRLLAGLPVSDSDIPPSVGKTEKRTLSEIIYFMQAESIGR